ncbi:hypothetical protein LJB89_04000 [Tyzzerella sp. OttesenSCG-928-J15]|nr:hypothetical protein [Tyzzerella sp. OttesenSCG-928-J15]
MNYEERYYKAVSCLITQFNNSVKTDGAIRQNANFRAAANIIYTMLFEEMYNNPTEAESIINSALSYILNILFAPASVRVSSFNRRFIYEYKILIEEIESYGMPNFTDNRLKLIDVIEEKLRELSKPVLFGIPDVD